MRRCLRTSIWLLLVFLLVPSPARANFGITTEGGQLVAEPIGGTGVVIRQESLTLDLRPLAEGDLAHIEASYRLHNPGPEMRHDLVFVSGSPGVTGFLVTLDGQSVASCAVQGFVVPDAWKVPDKTPGMRGGFDSYDPEDSKEPPVALACAVVLAPGAHELSVRYDAEAMVNHRSMPIVSRQFVYLLSPARSWANFKKLDVVVLLPSGWLAASLPVLTREGDTLRGSFDGLPSDAIALTVQAPEGWWHRILWEASLYVVLGVVAAGIPFCVLRGRACGRRLAVSTAQFSKAWPSSWGTAAIWWLAVVAATIFSVFVPDLTLPAHQMSALQPVAPLYLILLLLVELGILPIGFAATQVTAVVVRRLRSRRERSRREP